MNKKKKDSPSVGVQIVEVKVDALVNPCPHEGESLGRQTVVVVVQDSIALVPLGPLKVNPGVVAQRVQTIANASTAAGGGPVRMSVVLVERRVVVEVLLNMDDVVRLLVGGELLADEHGVGRLVAGFTIVLEDLRQTGDVEGEHVELATGSCRCVDSADAERRRGSEDLSDAHSRDGFDE